jgi:hypothetical protein
MSLRGLFADGRLWLNTVAVQLPAPQDLPALVAERYGLAPAAPPRLRRGERRQPRPVRPLQPRQLAARPALGSLAIGATVVAGWYLSGQLAFAEDPETLAPAFLATNSGRMESLSFVAPYAYSLELLMLWTDASRTSASASPPPPASLPAPCRRRRQPQLPPRRLPRHPDLVRHLAGAALMGFGGVTALGCTIGQGLSGLSTLSAGAALTVAGIIAGAALTLKVQLKTLDVPVKSAIMRASF